MRPTATAILIFISVVGFAQQGSYAPQVGEVGSTAMAADSSAFRDWAISCDLVRGLEQIDEPDSGVANSGSIGYAIGMADAPLTVSLGDGGQATLMFSGSFYDGPGADFAVFENGFGSGEDAFLELAFVSISSDGINFFTFPSVSEQQDTVQVQAFDYMDASLFHNLAGKYTAGYGVPFDIDDIPDTALLDKMAVTHVRIQDVVGTIDSAYATFDSQGHIINDPWPTQFDQGGFDLDAVGIIHSNIPVGFHSDPDLRHAQGPKEYFDVLGRPISGESVRGMVIERQGSTYQKRYVQRP